MCVSFRPDVFKRNPRPAQVRALIDAQHLQHDANDDDRADQVHDRVHGTSLLSDWLAVLSGDWCLGLVAEWPVARGVVSPGVPWSMQSQIQPARRGARRTRSHLNRGVGRKAVLNRRGGANGNRPRSRSASDPSDGEAAVQRDRWRPSLPDSGLEGDGLEAEERRGARRAADTSVGQVECGSEEERRVGSAEAPVQDKRHITAGRLRPGGQRSSWLGLVKPPLEDFAPCAVSRRSPGPP